MTNTVDSHHKSFLIKNQPFFSRLTEEEAGELAGLFVERHYAAGETIVTEGDPVDSVLLIVSGTADVRHIRIIDKGRTQIESVAVLKEGDAIGLSETGFYSLSGVRTATVTAVTEMVALYLSIAAFRGFALTNKHVSEMLRKQNQYQLPPV